MDNYNDLVQQLDKLKVYADETDFVKVTHEEAEAEEKGKFTEKKIIHTALHGFGADKQRIKCIEEMSELIKELCKDGIGEGKPFHIAEEIADVEILLAQMKIFYGCENTVTMIKRQKLKQLAEKLGVKCHNIRQEN